MNGERFDQIGRALATGLGRRQAMGVLAAMMATLVVRPPRAKSTRQSCREGCRALFSGQELGDCRNACAQGELGPWCGCRFCSADQYCCNPSCGACAVPGHGCIQELCETCPG